MKNKKIVITGASSGIGLLLVKNLCIDNLIFAVARNVDNIPEHKNITKYSADISIPENIDNLFDACYSTFGDIDIFIANAGFAYCEIIKNPDWQHIQSIFNTNTISVFYSISKLKQIKQNAEFQFVVTASAISYISYPGYSLYSATKYALRGFADAYRHELNNNQILSLIYPVAMNTNFFNIANTNTKPWPEQKPEIAVKRIIKGIQKKKKNIHPSRLFYFGKIINNLIPIFYFVQRHEGKKLKKKFSHNFT